MDDSTSSEDELLALTYQGGKLDIAADRVDHLFATLRARFNKYASKKKGFGDSTDGGNNQSGVASEVFNSGNRKNASSPSSEVDGDGATSNTNASTRGGPLGAEGMSKGTQGDFKLTSLLQAVQRNTEAFSGDEATPRVTYGDDPAGGLDGQELSMNGSTAVTSTPGTANATATNGHAHRRVSSTGYAGGGSATADPNAMSILQSSVHSAAPITSSKRSNHYWETRELYIAAEELCCYLNGGVDYRGMCKYYQQTLNVLLRLIREDVELLRGMEVLPRGTVTDALGQLQALLTESVGLLETGGVNVPPQLREQATRLQSYATAAGAADKNGSPAPTVSLLGQPSPTSPGGFDAEEGSTRLDDGSFKKSRRPTLPAPKKGTSNLSTIFKEFQPFPIVDLDPADAALLSGHDQGKDGSGPNANALAAYNNNNNNNNNTLEKTPSGFSATFAAHLEDVVAQPQNTSGGSIVSSNTRTHSFPSPSLEGTLHQQSSGTHDSKRGSILGFNKEKGKKAAPAAEEKPLTPVQAQDGAKVPHPPAASSAQTLPPPRTTPPAAVALAATSRTAPTPPIVEPVSPLPVPQEGTDEPPARPQEEGGEGGEALYRRASDGEEPSGPLSAKERLRRMEQLYGEGYYLDGMQLLKDALGTVFRWEYDQDPAARTTAVAAVFNTSVSPQEPSPPRDTAAAATTSASAVTTESAFLSFKKDYQEYLAALLQPAAHATAFVRATADTTPLRSEYLMECLSYHIKPNEVLLSTFEKVKKDRDVTRLELQGVAIGDTGMLPFSVVLPRLYKLKTLDLRQAGVQEEGLEALSLGLRYHPSLEVLNLSHNNLTDRSLPALLRIVRTVPHLQTIFLFGCPISSATREEVQQQVQRPATHLVYTPLKRKRRPSAGSEGRWSSMSTPVPRLTSAKLVPAPVGGAATPSPTRGQSEPVPLQKGEGRAKGALTPVKPSARRPSKNGGPKVVHPPRVRGRK